MGIFRRLAYVAGLVVAFALVTTWSLQDAREVAASRAKAEEQAQRAYANRPAPASQAQQFITVASMVEALYPEVRVQVQSERPPSIDLGSPYSSSEDRATVIVNNARHVVSIVYRTFLHTDRTVVEIVAAPYNPDTGMYLWDEAIRAKVTRAQAWDRLKQHWPDVGAFDDLIAPQEGDRPTLHGWSASFARFLYDDQGEPGVSRFAAELSRL